VPIEIVLLGYPLLDLPPIPDDGSSGDYGEDASDDAAEPPD
jgi:hypothetical protein